MITFVDKFENINYSSSLKLMKLSVIVFYFSHFM